MAGHLLFDSGSNVSSLAPQFKWLDNTFKLICALANFKDLFHAEQSGLRRETSSCCRAGSLIRLRSIATIRIVFFKFREIH